MTRNQIIAELFTSKDFNACIKKMKPESLQDELKAEVALILCEKPDGVIIELWELGKLRFYTVRIILNLIQSSSSPFYKKFRTSTVELSEIAEPMIIEYDGRKDHAINEIENLYWYDKEILKLYIQYGTYRKVEEITGIPFESIYKTVQKASLQIRKKVA
jgi:hypothetical protein